MADTKTKGYTAVSAPGKVLLAGGYLVLDRAYTGLVFGLSARIHVIVQDATTATAAEGGKEPLVVVRSPQFVDAEWRYSTAVLGDGAGVAVKQLESPSTSRNPFVETTLTYTLSYLLTTGLTTLPSLTITILADNDYYSQPTSTTTSPSTTT
ncbi:hypothetical protein V498_08577, partial [Pseudogymnoascus sp. VKM F-4517 (FW-2822)]